VQKLSDAISVYAAIWTRWRIFLLCPKQKFLVEPTPSFPCMRRGALDFKRRLISEIFWSFGHGCRRSKMV